MTTENPPCSRTIAVLGNWHLAHVTTAGLAKLGHRVLMVPTAGPLSDEMRQNFTKPQLFEPGLDEIWSEQIHQRLSIHSLEETAHLGAEIYFLSLDTPVDENDKIELDAVFEFVNALKNLPKTFSPKTLVVQSQVPVGTSRKVTESLRGSFEVINMPENLRLGKAISLFLDPEFMYLGGDPKILGRVCALFPQWKCPIKELSLEEAEMVKHSTNFYLALCVSYSSFISDLCEDLGISAAQVVEVLRLDTRVSPRAPLSPGFGFAGGTLGRDVQVLRELAGDFKEFKKFGDAVYEINEFRIPRLIRKVQSHTPAGTKVTLLGLTYKAGTDTLRRSHALSIADALGRVGYSVSGYDPKVRAITHPDLFDKIGLKIEGSLDEALEQSRCLILCTPWPEFLERDWTQLTSSKRHFLDLTGLCMAQFKMSPGTLPYYYTPGYNPPQGRQP